MSDPSPPECIVCGACCFSDAHDYVPVTEADEEQMDELALSFTQAFGGSRFMAMEERHCKALVIDPVHKTFMCAIYESRPHICRLFDRGSDECRRNIAKKAEWTLVAAERLLGKRRSNLES